jgi:hypothetical protein
MPYYPLSQIKPNLFTNGGEYVLSTTKENYKGPYYELSNGRRYTGGTPQDGPNILLIKPTQDITEGIMSGLGDWFTGSKPNDQSVTPVSPSIAPSAANNVYGKSAQVAEADKRVPLTKSTNVVNAPTQVNNQTQTASFKRPIRNEDNTLSGWLKTKFS